MHIVQILILNFACLWAAAIALWAVSVRLRNASIVDIFWAIFCAAPAFVTLAAVDGAHPRDIVLTGLAGLWALRLSSYLARRNIGHGEDYRYVAMRRSREARGDFARWSLSRVFLLQATIAWFVSLPVQVGQFGPDRPLGLVAFIGIAVFLLGLAFEAVGDAQLRAFKRDPGNKGKLMTSGLWSWTRHPNYFGDACVWFGLGLIALEGPAGWIGAASPFVMAHFLVNVSGKALLERAMTKKYPAYEEYRRRTSGFFPLPPRIANDAEGSGVADRIEE
ncbi:MAG: DUF1295 domain-containing protein [Alphaproteobacteria bacterium]|nr:DUF1295 domain-containing protein [Alphaproteobacteria bacterium]